MPPAKTSLPGDNSWNTRKKTPFHRLEVLVPTAPGGLGQYQRLDRQMLISVEKWYSELQRLNDMGVIRYGSET